MIRAAMEGVALGLRQAFDRLRPLTQMESEMVVVGGGSRSGLWRQILADALGTSVVKTSVDQQAAALGAAALAAVGTGLWRDFARIDALHRVESRCEPVPNNCAHYDQLVPIYGRAAAELATLGTMLAAI
jgi:xylulokinase